MKRVRAVRLPCGHYATTTGDADPVCEMCAERARADEMAAQLEARRAEFAARPPESRPDPTGATVTAMAVAAPATGETREPVTVGEGIIHALPEDDYHTHPALSSTGARLLLSCPAKFEWNREHPREPTQAMKEGKAGHKFVLGVGADIVPVMADSWRTKAAKSTRDSAEAAGGVALLAHDVRRLLDMRSALVAHPLFGRLFDMDRGDPEVSVFWTDKETGVECRARFDFLPAKVKGKRLIIPDYKTGTDASLRGFARSAADYGYPMQADWYRRAAIAVDLDPDPAFVFAAQETSAPYVVTVGQLQREDMLRAHDLNRRALHTFAACMESGYWPGYADQVVTFDMPIWWRIQADLLNEEELSHDQHQP